MYPTGRCVANIRGDSCCETHYLLKGEFHGAMNYSFRDALVGAGALHCLDEISSLKRFASVGG